MESNKPRRFEITKHGLAENPIGAQVALNYQGRTLLGDVVGCRYRYARGCFLLTVRHFNGEAWPIEPRALAVEVLRP